MFLIEHLFKSKSALYFIEITPIGNNTRNITPSNDIKKKTKTSHSKCSISKNQTIVTIQFYFLPQPTPI